jgi:hypothetical protein
VEIVPYFVGKLTCNFTFFTSIIQVEIVPYLVGEITYDFTLFTLMISSENRA